MKSNQPKFAGTLPVFQRDFSKRGIFQFKIFIVAFWLPILKQSKICRFISNGNTVTGKRSTLRQEQPCSNTRQCPIGQALTKKFQCSGIPPGISEQSYFLIASLESLVLVHWDLGQKEIQSTTEENLDKVLDSLPVRISKVFPIWLVLRTWFLISIQTPTSYRLLIWPSTALLEVIPLNRITSTTMLVFVITFN